MKHFNNITITVFAKPEEDAEKVKQKLAELIPFNLVDEKINLSEETATGFNERAIKIYKILLIKEKHTNKFFASLKQKLSSLDKKLLLAQVETRIDEELNFFIRLDKQQLFNDVYEITDSGDCYHIKMLLLAFPKKRERAVELIKRQMF